MKQDDRDQRRNDAVDRVVESLTDKTGNYYPFSADNFSEAVGEMPAIDLVRIVHDLEGGRLEHAGGALLYAVKNYWSKKAKEKATESIASGCQHCFGDGCSRCEDSTDYLED
jgi:hypothetical protein